MTWLIVVLVAAVLVVVVWLMRRREPDIGELERRRTAEERLRASADRAERRRRIGLDDKDEP